MPQGYVKWFNASKGFGFITPEDGGDDLFVHQSSILVSGFRMLSESEVVQYDIDISEGKHKAINVAAAGGGQGSGGRGGGGGRAAPAGPRKWPEGVDPSEGKQIGCVKWFNSEKGFGFIAPASGGKDLFVHHSAIASPGFRSLMEGEEVEFKVVEERGKMKAVDVTGPNGEFVQGGPKEPRGGGY